MLKRIAAAAAISLVPVGLAAAPAHAYGSCNISAPSKVAIVAPYRAVTTSLGSSCYYSDTMYSSWDLYHSTRGWQDIVIFDGTDTDYVDLYDWDPVGTYTFRPSMAVDWDYNNVDQNTRTMVVRLGSRLSAARSRSGKYVTVSGTATRYAPKDSRYGRWANASVVLRQKSCASCAWKTVRTGTTNRYGKVSFKVYSPKASYWQLSTKDTGTTWGKVAGTMYR